MNAVRSYLFATGIFIEVFALHALLGSWWLAGGWWVINVLLGALGVPLIGLATFVAVCYGISLSDQLWLFLYPIASLLVTKFGQAPLNLSRENILEEG